MGVNKDHPHVLVLPEDANFAAMAMGFKNRLGNPRQLRVEGYGRGKDGLLERVRKLVSSLNEYDQRYLVVLFDGDARRLFESSNADLPVASVFCLSTRDESEDLRREFV